MTKKGTAFESHLPALNAQSLLPYACGHFNAYKKVIDKARKNRFSLCWEWVKGWITEHGKTYLRVKGELFHKESDSKGTRVFQTEFLILQVTF